jgi:hypothetical protein
MKRSIIIIVAALIIALAALLAWSHFRQDRILGLWSAPLDASVQFMRGGVFTYHASSVEVVRNPAAPHSITGSYKIADVSHIQLTMPGFGPLVATYSLAGNTLNLTIADEPKTYTRVSH